MKTLSTNRPTQADFRALADNSRDGILIVLADGTPAYANARVSEITGFEHDRIMATDFDELLGRAEYREIAAYAAEVEQSGEAPHYATEVAGPEGTAVPVELTVSRTLWLGNPARVVVMRDISTRKQLEEREREQQQRLMRTDKLVSLGVLAASMAHQISDPNQSILLSVGLLQRACPQILSILRERSEEGFLVGGLERETFCVRLPQVLAAIAGCSQRIDSISKNLTAFSRDEPPAPASELDVNAVVGSAVELISTFTRKATSRFSVQLADDLPRVSGSALRIEQVVINLIRNACQAVVSRDQAITVSTRYEREGDRIIVAVEDEGAGIPEEQLSRIPQPFYTTRRAQGGSGLGLFVAQTIAKEHGGVLTFDSSPGKGTRVEFSLPAGPRS